MTRKMCGLVLASIGLGATPALAGDHCNVPMADWQPREVLQRKLEDDGWKVLRIKTDDGCYKIRAVDAQGRRVEAKVDPGTLVILKQRVSDD